MITITITIPWRCDHCHATHEWQYSGGEMKRVEIRARAVVAGTEIIGVAPTGECQDCYASRSAQARETADAACRMRAQARSEAMIALDTLRDDLDAGRRHARWVAAQRP